MAYTFILKNTLIQLVNKAAGSILAFVTALILASFLGKDYFGEYIKITSYVTFYYVFVDFGMNTIFLREMEDKVESKLGTLFSLRLVGGMVVVFVSVIIIYFLGQISGGFTPLMQKGVWMGSVAIIGHAMFLSSHALYQHRLRFDVVSIIQGLSGVVAFILVLLLSIVGRGHAEEGVLLATGIFVVGTFLAAIGSLFFLRKTRLSMGFWQVEEWKKLLFLAAPLGGTLILNGMYFKVDTLLLTAFRTSAEVGAYGLSYKMFDLCITLPAFVMNSAYPIFLRSFNKIKIAQRLKRLTAMLCIVACVFTVIIWLGAPLLVHIQPAYSESVPLVRILSLSLPIFYTTSPLMWWFILIKKQRMLLYVYGGGLLMNLLLNIFFIPLYGATAAAWVTGVGEMGILTVALVLFFKTRYD